MVQRGWNYVAEECHIEDTYKQVIWGERNKKKFTKKKLTYLQGNVCDNISQVLFTTGIK